MTDALRSSDSVQGYIAGRLPETDRTAFENQLLADPRLVRDVETSLRLREGLEGLRDAKSLHSLTHPRRTPVFLGVACAAALVLAAFILPMVSHLAKPPAVMAASPLSLRGNGTPPVAVTGRYSFALMRSAAESPTIILPTGGALELRALVPDMDTNHAFRIAMEYISATQTASRIGAVDHVMADADGFAAVYLHASRMEPGDYVLIVQPEGTGRGPGERFEFRLQRPPGGLNQSGAHVP